MLRLICSTTSLCEKGSPVFLWNEGWLSFYFHEKNQNQK